MFSGLTIKLFRMQILDGQNYQDEYMQRTEKSVRTPGTRGNIYDCNGNLLAYNELSYLLTIQDTGDYSKASERNTMLYRLVTILENNGEIIEGKFKIELIDESGEMRFTTSSESAKTRFLLDFYGLSSADKLTGPDGEYPRDITAREAFEKKKESYELNDMKDENGNVIILSDRIALDMVNIIYTMKLTEYQKYEVTTVCTDISEKTMIEINENIADLKGIDVQTSFKRKYNDSIYFAPIIGYTGKVQEDDIEGLNTSWRQARALSSSIPDKYDLNDTVGRIGIEKTMEIELQGEKGYEKMYVDNMGRVKEIIEHTDATAGNDVYLTIDKDLQIAIYHLIEQQLAGIITYNLQMEDLDVDKTYDSSKKPIPVKDVYYQLINNDILSLQKMESMGASDIEKEIYNTLSVSQNSILSSISNELMSDHATMMKDLPPDMKSYMNYIYKFLSESNIIQKDKINQSSTEYQKWVQGEVSLRDYIYNGISENWIDISKLNDSEKYLDVDKVYSQLTDYVIESLRDDEKFTKCMLRYLINDNIITGNQLCLALFAQGVLDDDPSAIAGLRNNDSLYTYNFIKEKISDLELTPAQLALDPCTAGVVVTDIKTGEVKALVTYPSYDNNKMSGSVDAAYFSKINNDLSRPLYNNATQTVKAPGSTFKPITAIAALEEGVINTQDTIECTGIYDKIAKPIKCWIWPGRHGEENIEEGIQNSCNYFFAELAHRLCMKEDGTYSTEQGLATIHKYATMFGLDHSSGIEIAENEPQISNEDPERSAMGQGNHSYNNVQLSRYVTALANRGTVFELSLIDKLNDPDGKLIKDYTPTVKNKLDFKESTWDAVQMGMRRVITDSSAKKIFDTLSVEVAGKTGTAQEDRSRSNHAFFISFAPYSHPEIAVTVNIPYGYAGSNAATLGKRVYEYYYGNRTLDEILNSGSLDVSNVVIGD